MHAEILTPVLTPAMQIPPGLIVTFNPPPEFFTNLDSFYAQLHRLVLIDNGSDPEVRHRLEQEAQRRGRALRVIYNQTNLGIAMALNQGVRWAIEQGFQQILVFDQDSYPAPGMIQAMLEVYGSQFQDGQLAVVAPVVIDPVVNIRNRFLRPKNKWMYERVYCEGNILENVTYVITSGALYNLTAYRRIGPFRDDFFIDYVDTEYCLRARQFGYRIVVACNARLYHRQGDRQKRSVGRQDHYPTFHSPLRWYFMSRNRIPMLYRYALRFPYWFLYEVVATSYGLLKMLLFESHKKAKLRAIWLGIRDGLQGRMGKAPDDVLQAID